DVFDVPALSELMRDVASGAVKVVEVETQEPSPFARSLLFGYVGQFLYEGDSPLAERRAAALALDSALLAELLGQADLRELLAEAFLESVADPLGDLVSRYARTHGPFKPDAVARRFGLGVAVVHATLARMGAAGRLVEGELRPGGSGSDWCDAAVLRQLRRRS